MPRRTTPFLNGHYYHIYNRGAGKHAIFKEQDNYLYILRQTKDCARLFNLTIIAYVLMPNHYHFLIRQDSDAPVSELPKRVFGGYSRAVNRRYGWSGTLFEGRFQAIHITEDAHLRHLCRYIHANPVLHGFVNTPETWPYSNYLEWIGKRPGTLVNHAFIQEYFPNRSDYIQFVRDLIEGRSPIPETLKFPG
ncbi:MAG: transposase [Anaerolineales bacterium]|nr:transposase [Anaerolineales bacterium]MCB8952428.1 transposase [Ardenticatenales bacterium]